MGGKNSSVWVLVVIVVLVAFGLWWWSQQAGAPGDQAGSNDSAAAIEQELGNVNSVDVDAELNSATDADINSL